MFRIYCMIGRYRYYRTESGIWSMWSWAAQPLELEVAARLAKSEQAHFEEIR